MFAFVVLDLAFQWLYLAVRLAGKNVSERPILCPVVRKALIIAAMLASVSRDELVLIIGKVTIDIHANVSVLQQKSHVAHSRSRTRKCKTLKAFYFL